MRVEGDRQTDLGIDAMNAVGSHDGQVVTATRLPVQRTRNYHVPVLWVYAKHVVLVAICITHMMTNADR